MTYRPNDRQYTGAEAHFAHYRKAAAYGTQDAAREAARYSEARKGWPIGAMCEYPCPVPQCGGWHVGRTRQWVIRQKLDRRDRPDIVMMEVLGTRVMANAKSENTGPDGRRRAHINRFAKAIERMEKRSMIP